MTWRPDSRQLIVAADLDRQTERCMIASFDLETGASVPIINDVNYFLYLVSPDDRLIYAEGARLLTIDLRSGRSALLAEQPDGFAFLGPLSISGDGRTLGVYWSEDGRYAIGKADAESGEVRAVIRPDFAEPYPMANHAMVNPVHPRQLFYAHEGSTDRIPDRIWSVDTETGEAFNLYRQKRLASGEHGEYVGHEVWSYCGEWLIFVQYPSSPMTPRGVCRVSRHGGEAEWVNGDYRYWHVCPSPDGRYAVADTLLDPGLGSEIVLIDLHARTSRLLCHIHKWPHHPGHPHPSFSPDSRKISFTYADSNDRLRVGVIDLAQILEQ
uniref:TolB family protein n=1 Tax=Gorillibacterium massiliense TaxID=1280390 RepID=UPI000593BBE5|nr:hypothetical protein [Gorillibacterium massiliense]